MRGFVAVLMFVISLGACAQPTHQEELHTLRPHVPWPEKPEPAETATNTASGVHAMQISTFAPQTDAQIQALLIERSLASFAGLCPCPHSLDRAGDRCDDRSIYSKRGGRTLLCYPHDVSSKLIAEYRGRR